MGQKKRNRHREPIRKPGAADPTTPEPIPWPGRRFWPTLAVILLISLVGRIVILNEYVTSNPLAGTPINDANTYWQWAERIARGQLVQDEPFFSAPLYPYLLGLLRRLGGGLTTVYVVQMLTDLCTATVLACAGRRRFGPGAGLLAAASFLLLLEPASFSLRVLTSTLQLLLVALVYYQLLRVQEHPVNTQRVITGVVIGLLCLSYPPAMVLAVAVVPWLFWPSRRRVADVGRAAIPFGVAALIIAPATIHNYNASGNLFFIQSVTAVNLRQGNQPESVGIYTAIPDTHTGRERLFEDVKRLYAETTGREGTWADIDRHYRDQVIEFWRSKPTRTIWLASRKAWYFLSSQRYGDIYQPVAEIDIGASRWLRLTPLPVAWLMGPALVGLVVMLRRPVRYFPEWILFAVPFLLVTVFWYSPRYRLPAIPVIVIAAAWAVACALQWRRHGKIAVATGMALGFCVAIGWAGWQRNIDRYAPEATLFHIAHGLEHQGQPQAALVKYAEGFEVNPDVPAALLRYGDLLLELGQRGDALAAFERAYALQPRSPSAPRRIVKFLLEDQRFGQLDQWLTRYLQTHQNDATYVAVLASVKQMLGKMDDAKALYAQAIERDPDNVDVRLDYGALLFQLQLWNEAEAQYTRAIALQPANARAIANLGRVQYQQGRVDDARRSLRRSAELDPTDVRTLCDAARLELQQNRHDDATALVQRALELKPDDPECRAILARIKQRQRQATPGDGP